MKEIDTDKTALIVVDMQYDFCKSDGSLYSEASNDVIGQIRELVSAFDEAGSKIVYTQDTHTEEQFEDANYYDEFNRWGVHVKQGTRGQQIVEELEPDTLPDKVIKKETYNAFHNTELDRWLTQNNIRDIVFCGTLANVCVLHSASAAALRDYRPILVTDALGYIEEEHHQYAVSHADWLFGEITDSDSMISNL
jgi:nicotinamidase-related amidase